MRHALFEIDVNGIIHDTLFNSLEVNHDVPSVFSLFSGAEDKLLAALRKARNSHTVHDFHLCEMEVSGLLFPIDGGLYLYVAPPEDASLMKDALHDFLRALSPKKGTHPTDSWRFYEQIQKLNNELMNKSRKIEKLNRHLNRLNEMLNRRLITDPLTGLLSRYQYRDEIMAAIEKDPKKGGVFCYIDIDDFKAVNDTHGHRIGDLYLQAFATRLRSLPLENAIAMRIAGDEFGLFLHPVDKEKKTFSQKLWTMIRENVVRPVEIEGKSIPLRLSMGIVRYPEDTNEIHRLIDYADYAMYVAKRSGKSKYALFDKKKYERAKSS